MKALIVPLLILWSLVMSLAHAQSFGILERHDFEPAGYLLSFEPSGYLLSGETADRTDWCKRPRGVGCIVC